MDLPYIETGLLTGRNEFIHAVPQKSSVASCLRCLWGSRGTIAPFLDVLKLRDGSFNSRIKLACDQAPSHEMSLIYRRRPPVSTVDDRVEKYRLDRKAQWFLLYI